MTTTPENIFHQEEFDLGLPPAPEPNRVRGGLHTALSRSHLRGGIIALVATLTLVQVALVSHDLGTGQAIARPVVLSSQAEDTLSMSERVYAETADSVVSVALEQGGSGSGFFYAPGKIVTNAHVVNSAPLASAQILSDAGLPVIVQLQDGRIRDGKVTLVDYRLDVAIIEVDDVEDVDILTFAETSSTRPGQRVVAIGSPLGLVSSVTEGIISAPQRTTIFREDPVQAQLIQTDAAVNPGNSGGPLLNDQGQVLGIITIRPDSSDGRTITGVSFALPSDAVRASIQELEKDGEVEYVLIGVTGRSANKDDGTTGMVIEDLTPGGAADLAGAQTGDIITRLGDASITVFEDLTRNLYGKTPGEKTTLGIQRSGETLELPLTYQNRPEGT